MQFLISRGHFITLKNVLIVPEITKNLLSIFSPCLDSNLNVLLINKTYLVKDKVGKLLLQGAKKGGLFLIRERKRNCKTSV